MNQKEINNLVSFGKIVNTHGVKGEVKVTIYPSNFENDLAKSNLFFIKDEDLIKKQIISSIKRHKNIYLVKIQGVNNINQIEKYKNFEIYIDKESILKNNYLYHELIGMKVIFNNDLIGIVENYYIQGNFYSLSIVDNEELSIPINDRFIKNVNKINREITVDFPEGYL
ncbi:MAG: 16S rRNA processing protein RimM [Mycoplasmataceae bacterium]|nr:16S rRNA processing protein RimM [Mycoplasmataceae bacterium]